MRCPKSIMVREINDVAEFTSNLETNCIPYFLVEVLGRWVKILTKTYPVKSKIVEYLKERKFQFYVVHHLEAPMKVVMRGS